MIDGTKVAEFLNEVLKADPVAMRELFDHRVECNAELGEHPLVETRLHCSHYSVGFLGLINGLLRHLSGEGWVFGPVVGVYSGYMRAGGHGEDKLTAFRTATEEEQREGSGIGMAIGHTGALAQADFE